MLLVFELVGFELAGNLENPELFDFLVLFVLKLEVLRRQSMDLPLFQATKSMLQMKKKQMIYLVATLHT
jgi:hypothetical protein